MNSTIKTITKGYYRLGKTQRFYRREWESFLEHGMIRFVIMGSTCFLSNMGIELSKKAFDQDKDYIDLKYPECFVISNPDNIDNTKIYHRINTPIEKKVKGKTPSKAKESQNLVFRKIKPNPNPTIDEFLKLLENEFEKVRIKMGSKSEEYRTVNNAFRNFDEAAKLDNTRREEAIWGMMKKQLISVIDIINNDEIPSKETIDEKFGDLINYLLLIKVSYLLKAE